MSGSKLELSKETKLLGVTHDSKLSDVNKKNEACFFLKKRFFLLVFFGLKKNIVFFVFNCYL